ncbi:TVP38/TMEM64 family protein [Oceanidesulfovibrio marinus]|uniref:TVP38/TMEM64 family membrane protein n=1 Tax=Oceanidesulfovibrio marinus TaxID=370038 RepID=A0A6P1ZGA2_9BACT|nr:TVP38/TMEM64 family protein [Oceanidesulfovibrio marinus]QJT09442.1 TVP38/TMEM64 family protein [Oceanidesulfovibrio marinus]TVM33665.1 TVP38/TMEM64 family protein [Oceanidesulfovibrio marinus]
MQTKTWKKLAILGAIAVAVVLFFALGLHKYLTLSQLKGSRDALLRLYQEHTVLFVAAYFAAYVAIAALSLPGAAVMTLAGSAILGFWTGLITVSFASSIGALLACAISRYVAGGYVQRRFGDKLGRFNAGIEREGAFYLFTLRLIPVFPFFVINLVMGLTRMPLVTFYWVSQLGMLPGTAVYVNAGTQLGELDSLSGILSWQIIASFALLGIFPLVAKKVLGWYRAKKGLQAAPVQEPSVKN